MIWADCSRQITNSEAAEDDLSKYYLDVLYGRISESSITNNKLKHFYNVGNSFDLVVSNFSVHYFFENEDSIKNLIENVSKSLRSGGKFVLTTLNGEKVFEKLKYDRVIMSPNMSWKITKKYTHETFPSTQSLG